VPMYLISSFVYHRRYFYGYKTKNSL
jgi:hypothetical protein